MYIERTASVAEEVHLRLTSTEYANLIILTRCPMEDCPACKETRRHFSLPRLDGIPVQPRQYVLELSSRNYTGRDTSGL